MSLTFPHGISPSAFGERASRLLGSTKAEGELRPYANNSYPATSNAMMRASVLRELGGFDVTFRQGGEDTELFARAKHAGHEVWLEPAATMQHILPAARLTGNGLRWIAQRVGAGEMRLAYSRHSQLAAIGHAIVRCAVVLVRDLPQWLFSAVTGNARLRLDAACSLWYTQGVLQALRSLLSSAGQNESGFLKQMDFRSRNGERRS